MPRSIRRVAAPLLIEKRCQRMAVVRTTGDPNVVADAALSALYGAVYPLRFRLKKQGIEFVVGPLRARWPDAHLRPKDVWAGIWGLPIPDDTTELLQKDPAHPLEIENWEYGTVAENLHRGGYATESPDIERLQAFITEQGHEISGTHEEEYLTRPTAKVPKTIIRYPVRKRDAERLPSDG